jgi:hypothetical protein
MPRSFAYDPDCGRELVTQTQHGAHHLVIHRESLVRISICVPELRSQHLSDRCAPERSFSNNRCYGAITVWQVVEHVLELMFTILSPISLIALWNELRPIPHHANAAPQCMKLWDDQKEAENEAALTGYQLGPARTAGTQC